MDTHTTFDFRIDSLSRETLPMLQLAEFATCLGNELVTKLRTIDTDWSLMDDPQAELRRFRRA